MTGLSDIWPLSSRALYQIYDLIDEAGMTKGKNYLMWLQALGFMCFNNEEASLTWLVVRSACGSTKGFLSAIRNFTMWASRVVIGRSRSRTPLFTAKSYGRCANLFRATYFTYWMKSFPMETSYVCSNVVPSLLIRHYDVGYSLCFMAYQSL